MPKATRTQSGKIAAAITASRASFRSGKSQAEEDGSETEALGEPRYIRRGGVEVILPARIRRIREKLGPTQSAFAKRFGLSERTVAEWELGRQSPTGPALVLLRVIECEPEAVERALKGS